MNSNSQSPADGDVLYHALAPLFHDARIAARIDRAIDRSDPRDDADELAACYQRAADSAYGADPLLG